MKQLIRFIRTNTALCIGLLIAAIIIPSYIITMDWPELIPGVERWFNLLFQLSIGYTINFMFYLMQVYLPNIRRDMTVRRSISIHLDQIIKDMESSISQLANVYIKDHTGVEYTEEELNQLLKLRFQDHVHVADIGRSTPEKFVYFTVSEWLSKCINETDSGIDRLLKYYAPYISADLMIILNDVSKSTYHTTVKMLLSAPCDVDFTHTNDNFFITYQKLIRKLKSIKQNDYDY